MRTRRQFLKVLAEPVAVRSTTTVDLSANAETVWNFMWDPGSAPVLNPDTEIGITVPGTPGGQIGEVQAFVGRADGQRFGSMLEVEELLPFRRAVTRDICSPFDQGGILSIDPLTGESCRLTQELYLVLPAGHAYEDVDTYRLPQTNYLMRLRLRLIDVFGEPGSARLE